jgi:hypothetical protein
MKSKTWSVLLVLDNLEKHILKNNSFHEDLDFKAVH